MKKAIVWIVILAVAVIVLIVKLANVTSQKNENDGAKTAETVIDNIMTRTSVRRYQDTPVEDEKVEQLLRAAMAAPSAGDKRPWEFVVITDKEILGEISANIHTSSHAVNAPLVVVVCGDMTKTFPEDGLDYWVEDTSAAAENLLLAAHGLGLGAVWCGIYPMRNRVAFLSELLHLPGYIVPMNIITIGYPAEDPAPKDKWDESRIHRNVW